MATQQDTTNWPELAIGLYDKLTGRDAEGNPTFAPFDATATVTTPTARPRAAEAEEATAA